MSPGASHARLADRAARRAAALAPLRPRRPLAETAAARARRELVRARPLVDSLRAPVEQATGLTFRRPRASALRSRETRCGPISFASSTSSSRPRKLKGLETAYKLFGLLPDTLQLRALLLDLYTEQVAGLLRPGLGHVVRLSPMPTRRSSGWSWRTRWCTRSRASTCRSTRSCKSPPTTTGSGGQSVLEGQATLASIEVLRAGQGRRPNRRSSGSSIGSRRGSSSRRCRSLHGPAGGPRVPASFRTSTGRNSCIGGRPRPPRGHAPVRSPHAGLDRADPLSRSLRPGTMRRCC